MSEFTKGQWRIVDDNDIYSGDTFIAGISINRIGYEERDANARIIVAAPQMYEMLHEEHRLGRPNWDLHLRIITLLNFIDGKEEKS